MQQRFPGHPGYVNDLMHEGRAIGRRQRWAPGERTFNLKNHFSGNNWHIHRLCCSGDGTLSTHPHGTSSETLMVSSGAAARALLWHKQEILIGKHGRALKLFNHRNGSFHQLTWQGIVYGRRCHIYGKVGWSSSTCASRSNYHYRGTSTSDGSKKYLEQILRCIRYKSRLMDNNAQWLLLYRAKKVTLMFLCFWWSIFGSSAMAEECRCSAANQELGWAKHVYETRMASKHKRKIAEWEAKVKSEEDDRAEDSIAEEVAWIKDPGTLSKRATQLVRTKEESLRVKTLLAKALEAINEDKEQVVKEINLTDSQMSKIVDYHNSLDGRISMVHEEVHMINKKLTLLIRILRDTVHPEPVKQKPAATEVLENEPIENIQTKVDRHVFEVGMDTISHMGKYV